MDDWLDGCKYKKGGSKGVEVEMYVADENRTKYFCIIYNVECNQKVTFNIRLR